jgi:hypothetical protein
MPPLLGELIALLYICILENEHDWKHFSSVTMEGDLSQSVLL